MTGEGMEEFQKYMTDAFTNVFKNLKVSTIRPARLSKFSGSPRKTGDLTLREWVEELDIYCRNFELEDEDKAEAIFDHLTGQAKDEIRCLGNNERKDPETVLACLREHFAPTESLTSISNAFHSRIQLSGESLGDFSRALMTLYNRMEKVANTDEKKALNELKDSYLKGQFIKGVASDRDRTELKRLEGKTFSEMRDTIVKLLQPTQPLKGKLELRTVQTVLGESTSNSSDLVATRPLVQQLVKDQQARRSDMKVLMASQIRTESKLDNLVAGASGGCRSSTSQNRCHYC